MGSFFINCSPENHIQYVVTLVFCSRCALSENITGKCCANEPDTDNQWKVYYEKALHLWTTQYLSMSSAYMFLISTWALRHTLISTQCCPSHSKFECDFAENVNKRISEDWDINWIQGLIHTVKNVVYRFLHCIVLYASIQSTVRRSLHNHFIS